MSVADEVLAIYGAHGGGAYFGERVTITEHCLQAAWFAQVGHAPASLIVAALLHDIGHLLEAVPDDLAEWTTDARHEEVGARWLAGRFGPEVSEPVRLHVPAKRYLCATDPDYFRQLSSASVHTLALQGGPMAAAEIARFEREPHHLAAVRVRRWDDQGKVAGLTTPPLESYRGMIEAAVRGAQG
ncbi:MAG TPA: HD domain-containing protein [Steroidobacteraceae bacterium]|nr:HD domain-containing protein [Steroidobacteraceae bacterium]